MRWSKLAAISCSLMVIGAGAARADAIDGHWCFSDGKRIWIQGPAIVTPAGSRIQGDYERHFFSYVVPPADPGAGQVVSLTLINEDNMRLSIGSAPTHAYDGSGEIWRRCGPPTS
jgi:hypothetical protein